MTQHPASTTRARRRVRVGISTCPNDTFAFHGLLTGAVEAPGLDLEFELRDVQELNEGVLAGRYDIAKVSFHLALQRADELLVLPSGSALGFGNGPLLLASPAEGASSRTGAGHAGGARPGPTSRVLCPGEHTTAALLYRIFHPRAAAPRHVVFSEIMPALERGDADFGVCIHEGRFTYAARGLVCVEDLGEVWARATHAPLPLGGIVARRAVGEDVARRLQAGLRASLAHARQDPQGALATMREHAAELDDDVLWQHVELYVNPWTLALGDEGRRALAALSERAHAPNLEVLPPPREPIVHLVDGSAFAAHDWTQPWAPPSLATEGFVHLSFASQVQGTLAAHFQGATDVRVLELSSEHINDALVLEPSRGGAHFPHLYRALEPRDVLATRRDSGI
ncbi:MAG: MqnA/MqnD/SBP family protein [Planctomycetota bacterium]